MKNKIYKSAQGRQIDLGSLIQENESARSVGNMKVNARGDVLDKTNTLKVSRNQEIAEFNNQQVSDDVQQFVSPVQTQAKPPEASPHIEEIAAESLAPLSKIVKNKTTKEGNQTNDSINDSK